MKKAKPYVEWSSFAVSQRLLPSSSSTINPNSWNHADPSSYELVFGPTNGANNATDYYFALVFVFLNQYDVNTCAEQTVVLANTSKYGELRSTEFPLHTLAVWSVKLIRHYSQIYIFKKDDFSTTPISSQM